MVTLSTVQHVTNVKLVSQIVTHAILQIVPLANQDTILIMAIV